MHCRLRRWSESGVIEQIFRHLAADHDNEYMMIDSTIADSVRDHLRARAIGDVGRCQIAISKHPSVSTTICRLRPTTFLPAS